MGAGELFLQLIGLQDQEIIGRRVLLCYVIQKTSSFCFSSKHLPVLDWGVISEAWWMVWLIMVNNEVKNAKIHPLRGIRYMLIRLCSNKYQEILKRWNGGEKWKRTAKADWYKYILGEYEGFLDIIEECVNTLPNELYTVGDWCCIG